ncbi:MAG: hypothetical protein JWQ81_5346 [Amycolatopsis sp.]|jgi:hypothetical protein|uniref:hypothetical protein n=1 Tax=Amycolatopsis sp. TaxID=37632 RepID=UPI0026085914|nr:hypothetical protein [Amycolatopsis sp.]MCU1684607.1 hypothetical protein [Amycolatopsis sp.]
MTVTAAVRVPGRRRFAGLLSGDTPTLLALFAIAILVNAFANLEWWRRFLIGQSAVDANAALGLLVVCCALSWRAMLRRGFVWAEPAALTWLDYTGADRVRVIGKRLWAVWLGGLIAVGYAVALVAAASGLTHPVWLAAAGLLVGSSVLSLATVRRAPAAARVEVAGPILLALVGVFIAVAGLAPQWLMGAAAVLLVAGCVLWVRSGTPNRPAIAAGVRRDGLVDGWNEKLVRSVAVTFLDPTMLFPAAHAVGGHSLAKPTTLRFAVLGVRGRSRYFGAAALLAIAVSTAHAALPGLHSVVLVAIGGYAALMPFAGGIGELWGNAGRRRWVGTPEVELRLVHALVLAVVALGWGLAVALVDWILGTPVDGIAWLALPLVVASVLRTAVRPPPTFEDLGITDSPFGQLPTRLIKQFVRGPDLGIIGLVVLSLLPVTSPVTWLVLAGLIGWCLIR